MPSSSSSSADPAAFAPSASASRRADESDLDPAAFLKSVRELSEKREREDAERYRKLEEDIERSRQDRAARRAERARSISPQKRNPTAPSAPLSPANASSLRTPPPITPRAATLATMDTSPPIAASEIPEFRGFGSADKTKMSMPSSQSPPTVSTSSESASISSPSASSLARSGTLSWQQRPPSRGAASRPRSMVLPESSSHAENTGADGQEVSRGQIAASLGARDPSWFKQTADRGVGNAAYRKNLVDGALGDGFGSSRRGLPGMQRELPQDTPPQTSPAPSESVKSDTPSYITSSGQFSTTRTSTSSKPDLKSLIAEDAGQADASPMSQRTFSTPNDQQASLGRTSTMSSAQSRLANSVERPNSPTKGMGGFVQSAMLKRSDSVSKRWSAQPGGSIARSDSISSARNSGNGLAGSQSMPRLEPVESTNETATKPSSSSTNNLIRLGSTAEESGSGTGGVKPSTQERGRTSTTSHGDRLTSPPASPSKRWSPTKSTWLESAITRPDSPKPLQARNAQPTWMADIAKAKAQRASVDLTPKQMEEIGSRSSSPSKQLFGQSVLKRSESRDLATPPITTPKRVEQPASKFAASPASTTKPMESAPQTKSPDAILSPRPTVIAPQGPVQSRPSPGTALDTKPTVQSSTVKSKPETPPKPQTDFRGNLRARPQPEAKQEEVPEFLAKFGNLRKATTQNYVAPDVLKGNILRGKSDLTRTEGPVKTERRDELKESLVAKKEQWKKEKDEGSVHERKVSLPPVAPQKPEALAKRDALAKHESMRLTQGPEKPRDTVPEAVARQKSVRDGIPADDARPELQKQASAPTAVPIDMAPLHPKKQTSTPVTSSTPPMAGPTETSKMAARFNPGLAGILARGPPGMGGDPSASSQSASFAEVRSSSASRTDNNTGEPTAESAQLQDMRKGRAKGPKKRKGATKDVGSEDILSNTGPTPGTPETVSREILQNGTMPTHEPAEERQVVSMAKPQAQPGSAASVMMSSLHATPSSRKPMTPTKNRTVSGPRPLIGSPAASVHNKPSWTPNAENEKPDGAVQSAASSNVPSSTTPIPPAAGYGDIPGNDAKSTPQNASVPEFRGFGSMRIPNPSTRLVDDDKENVGEGSPSAKSTASHWGQPAASKKMEPPAQIKLPSKRDEEAAMRSAGLLASTPSRPGSSNGLGISTEKSNGAAETPPPSAGLPPKPTKSSRAVSGQLQEASPNRGGSLGWFDAPKSANSTEQQLRQTFGTLPKSSDPLSIDTQAVISTSAHQERIFKTIRKSVQVALLNGALKELSREEEYTFFDESVYICTHAYSVGDGPKKTEMFLWSGDSSSRLAAEQAESTAKRLCKDVGSAYVHAVSQGLEPAGFLQALGGMLVTRRGSYEAASKQYMLRGRKHLGQIVFDEVVFGVRSLQSGFAYLISYPETLQDARMYLWKGSASSTEEVSAARLAAADLSPTQEVIEVDDGAEFASFLKIFGAGTTKANIDKPSGIWAQKALSPNRFVARLFRIQPAEVKAGIFSNIFTRRPSWGNGSPARKDDSQVKLTSKEISPFTQSDLEADCTYLLDAYNAVYVLVGPVFPSQSESVRNVLFGQTLLFASDYAMLAASIDDRPCVPKTFVLMSGVPEDLKLLFRHWDEKAGLWGTGGLLAGGTEMQRRDEVKILDLDEVRVLVCDS